MARYQKDALTGHRPTWKMGANGAKGKGKAKEVAGKVTGDSKLETEGKADQVAGKIQNTVGGIKDKIRETAK